MPLSLLCLGAYSQSPLELILRTVSPAPWLLPLERKRATRQVSREEASNTTRASTNRSCTRRYRGGEGEAIGEAAGGEPYLENYCRSQEDFGHSWRSITTKQPAEEGGGLDRELEGGRSRSLTWTVSRRGRLSRSLSRVAAPSSRL